MKTIDLNEFREKGYLQEANRKFFHPLGLALTVGTDENNQVQLFVQDSREDPEGFAFDFKNRSKESNAKSIIKRDNILNELQKRSSARVKLFGDVIEEIDGK